MSKRIAIFEIMECPFHHVRGLFVGNTRLTSLKCCGCWDSVEKFYTTDSPEDIAELLEDDIMAREREKLKS